MATSKEDIKTNYPLPVYNYLVQIGTETVAFSEVSGLSIGYETTTYKESPGASDEKPVGPRVMNMPAQATATDITLKKGLVPAKSKPVLFDWIAKIQNNQVEKKDILVSLRDEAGTAVITWEVSNAFPTKLDAPTFDANSNDVAIESMELRADSISIK
jgi:phage tail-like protein